MLSGQTRGPDWTEPGIPLLKKRSEEDTESATRTEHFGHRDSNGAIGRYEFRGSWPYYERSKKLLLASIVSTSFLLLLVRHLLLLAMHLLLLEIRTYT